MSKLKARFVFAGKLHTIHINTEKCIYQCTAHVFRIYLKGSFPCKGKDDEMTWHFGTSAGLRSRVWLHVTLCTPTWTELVLAYFFSPEVTVIYLACPQGVTHSYHSHGLHMSNDAVRSSMQRHKDGLSFRKIPSYSSCW
jgi:hypothetical protein